ncbi:hypothetical protein OJF2_46820 [Aquisphaera giovannonii]|uniref:Glycosyltransferase RgtA/B/C/D-like domain-containing protein n=1 Tax=Aquisphaera giovannonii TaxID=406548 RepID=A0A5B9W641_9BACT|nr:glycosyltransferase family 39 protein [Aquisphaera giovannonii]QEH36122.1 hypothetical protein OJF2_46820 [Aquisphaera giovannonii]
MTDPETNRDRSRALALSLGALCVATAVAAAAAFLPHQSLWNDEATQLSGLSLSPASQAYWLAGMERHDFGVSDDRMPPLSYWIGWAWSRLFGLGEASMRSLGVVAVAAATALVFAAGTRAWGLGAGTAAALLLGASPNIVGTAVEIRTYPLFVLSSAGLFHSLVRLLDDPPERGARWLAAMAAWSIAGAYLHFFGLVAAGAAFLAALILVPMRGGRLVPVLAACLVVGIAACGLWPFVSVAVRRLDAASVAGEPAAVRPSISVKAVARLAYRLVFHAAMRTSRVATAAGALGLVLASLACLPSTSRGREARLGLWVAWASGTLVVLASAFVTPLDVLASRYNVWMYPATALILGSGLASRLPAARWATAAGVSLLVASMLWGDVVLATRGDDFAHTGFALLDDAVRRLGVDRVAVVFDETDPEAAWQLYAPLRYRYRGRLRQYIRDQPAADGVRVRGYPKGDGPIDPDSIPAEELIVVRCGSINADDLIAQLHGGYREFGDGPVASRLKASPGWVLEEEGHTLTYFPAEIDILARKAGKPAAAAPPAP